LATTQDIIRRLIVVAEERGVTQLEARLRAVADAGGSVAAANATVATSTDKSERAVLSATRAFEGLERRFIPAAREAHNLDRALQQVVRFGSQTGEWQRAEEVFDAIARSSQSAAENVERLAMAQRGMAEHFRNQTELATGVTRTPASRLGASTSALAEQAAMMDKLEREARELLQAIDPVGQAQIRLAEATERVNLMLANGVLAPQQAAAALKVLEHNASLASKGVSVTTAQFANLGYQLNDVVSGLLMGQSPMTILVQQGGQVYQALQGPNGVMGAIREIGSRAASMVTPLRVALVGVSAAAIYAATAWYRFDESMVQTTRTLTGLGRQVGLTNEQFEAMASTLAKSANISVRSANEIMNAMARMGVFSARNLKEMGALVKNFAATFGTETTQAAEDMAKAFSSFSGIEELAKKLGFLTGAQLEQIKRLYEQGRAYDAVTLAVSKLNSALTPHEQVANRAASAWQMIKNAVSDADRALGSMISTMARMPSPAETASQANAVVRQRSGGMAGPEAMLPGAPSMRLPQRDARGRPINEGMGVPLPPPRPLEFQSPADQQERFEARVAAAREAEKVQVELNKRTQEARDAVLAYGASSTEQYKKIQDSLKLMDSVAGEGVDKQKKILELIGEGGPEAYERMATAQRSMKTAQDELITDGFKAQRLLEVEEELRGRISNERRAALTEERAALQNAGVLQSGIELDTAKRRDNVLAIKERATQLDDERHSASESLKLTTKYGQELEVSTQVMQRQIQFRQMNMPLTDSETAQIRVQIAQLTARNAVHQQGIAIFNNTAKPQQDFKDGLTAANELLKAGVINVNQYSQAILGLAVTAEQAKGTISGGFNAGILQLQKDFGDSAGMMKNFVSTTGNSMVSTFADIASGTQTASEGFKSLATTVLRAASEMIIKMMILGPLMKSLGGLFGGGTGIGGDVAAAVKHGGGLANGYGAKRFVHPAYFENAPRFHRGGLMAGEIPAILRANEEVLTPENPRHIMNGGGGGTINVNVTGARGNTEIMDMVSAGVRSGITSYDASLNQGGLARKMSNVRIRGQR
jgi:phage-related minor tail protein